MSGTAARGAPPPERFPLRASDALLIVAFWTVLALLTAASALLDPRGGPGRDEAATARVAIAFLTSYLWAALTPFIFWLGNRFEVGRPNWAARVVILAAAGVALAIVVEAVSAYLRFALFPGALRRPPPAGALGLPHVFDPLFGATRLFWLDDLIVYLAVLAAGFARDNFLRYRARQEEAVRLGAEAARLQAQLAEARLDALRRQLDPHFLFNTLHAVSSLVERDPRGVRRMISRLSDLLRHSIEGADEPEVPLRRELELLGRYVDIMQVRFQGRLAVETRADERALDALVPSLILQPLVENAIKHGVERRTEGGRIEITAAVEGPTLVLRVADDGAGPGAAVTTAGSGVGLRNTVARLEHLYGNDHRFSLTPSPAGGTLAEVRLPHHTRPPAGGRTDATPTIAHAG